LSERSSPTLGPSLRLTRSGGAQGCLRSCVLTLRGPSKGEPLADIGLIAPIRAYRDALATVIDSYLELRVVASGSSYAGAMSQLSAWQPAVMLVDFAVCNLVGVLSSLRQELSTIRVLGFGIETSRAHSEAVLRAAELGMVGFVDSDQPTEDLIDAVRLVLQGQSPCSPRIAALLLQAMQQRPASPLLPRGTDTTVVITTLTPRERMVADFASQGMTNRQIAARLVVEESTVKSHVHSILGKLGLVDRHQIGMAIPPYDYVEHAEAVN
jgi:two-component system, NarL family, nitrate/nitrite response regulator NarL